MTAKITDITNSLMANAANLQGIVPAANATKNDAVSDFSGALDTATEKISKVQSNDASKSIADTKQASNDAKDAFDKSVSKEIKSDDANTDTQKNNKCDEAKVADEAVSFGKEIADKVKELLDVDDKEFEEVMQTLGLTVADLINPQNVQSLCMEIKGIEDSISLLTDENLYANVKLVCNMASQAGEKLTAQNGIDMDTLKDILGDDELVNSALEALKNSPAQTGVESEGTAVSEAANNVLDNTAQEAANAAEESIDTNPVAGDFTKVITDDGAQGQLPIANQDTLSDDNSVLAENQTTGENEIVNAQNANASSKIEVTVTREDEKTDASLLAKEKAAGEANESETETFKSLDKSQQAAMKGRNEGFENASRFARTENTVVPSANTFTQTSINSVGDVVETVSHYTNIDGNEILSQITESIKVNYSADTTSMEMQLHPASLGTVNMHISSTNGIVTAHIVVENEAVKAALESQLITLQETFDASGQKVEAIEVSIANYDLNRGMNSETGNNSKGNSDEAFRRSPIRRRINLNDLNGDDFEDMTEEEMIAADMMARSGNSVDYMA